MSGRGRRPAGSGSGAKRLDPEETLYGRNPIREAVRARRRPIHQVWATASAARDEPWLAGLDVWQADAAEIAARAGTDAHQGMCAEVGPYPYVEEAVFVRNAQERGGLIVALDEVQDPQNLGTIVRSAECAGAIGLVIGRHRSAMVTGAAAKASAGAVEHLPIARVRNLADFLAATQQAGFWAYGAAADGVPYREPDYGEKVVLVMGSEGKGLRPRVREACDQLVAIPLRGQMESLNVSAAAAVLLYEISPASG